MRVRGPSDAKVSLCDILASAGSPFGLAAKGAVIRIEHLLPRLRAALAAVGADPDAPTPRQAWAAFSAFIREPLDDEHAVGEIFQVEGGCLEGYLMSSLPPGLRLARMVEVTNEGGDYEETRVVACDFGFDAPHDSVLFPYFCVQGGHLDGPYLAAEPFAAEVEADPGFRALLDANPPFTATVSEYTQ